MILNYSSISPRNDRVIFTTPLSPTLLQSAPNLNGRMAPSAMWDSQQHSRTASPGPLIRVATAADVTRGRLPTAAQQIVITNQDATSMNPSSFSSYDVIYRGGDSSHSSHSARSVQHHQQQLHHPYHVGNNRHRFYYATPTMSRETDERDNGSTLSLNGIQAGEKMDVDSSGSVAMSSSLSSLSSSSSSPFIMDTREQLGKGEARNSPATGVVSNPQKAPTRITMTAPHPSSSSSSSLLSMGESGLSGSAPANIRAGRGDRGSERHISSVVSSREQQQQHVAHYRYSRLAQDIDPTTREILTHQPGLPSYSIPSNKNNQLISHSVSQQDVWSSVPISSSIRESYNYRAQFPPPPPPPPHPLPSAHPHPLFHPTQYNTNNNDGQQQQLPVDSTEQPSAASALLLLGSGGAKYPVKRKPRSIDSSFRSPAPPDSGGGNDDLLDHSKPEEDEEDKKRRRLKYIRDACRKSRQKKVDRMRELERKEAELQNEIWRLMEADQSREEKRRGMFESFAEERRKFQNRILELEVKLY